MSGLIDKLKERAQRKSRSASQSTTDSPNKTRRSQDFNQQLNVTTTNPSDQSFRTSLDHSAFHVTTAAGRPASTPISKEVLDHEMSDPYQQRIAEKHGHSNERHPSFPDEINETSLANHIPARQSSLSIRRKPLPDDNSVVDDNPVSQRGQHQNYNEGLVPVRSSSRKYGAKVAASPVEFDPKRGDVVAKISSNISNHASSSGRSWDTHHKADELDNEHGSSSAQYQSLPVRQPATVKDDSSQEPDLQSKPLPAVPDKSPTAHGIGSDIRLPEGFDLRNSEKTYVTESVRPAVTHERIHKQRIEIVEENITKDIHVHHYYTYIQPIRVVEVLPARHFVLDEHTGEKREIATPPGWVLPADMQPTSPKCDGLAGWTRHYLVNKDHPNGILEAPPDEFATLLKRDSGFAA